LINASVQIRELEAVTMNWTIGDVAIHKIFELGSGATSAEPLIPDATVEKIVALPWLIPNYAELNGDLKLTVHSWLVQTPQLNIVVDTGVGNGKLKRSRPHWNDRNGNYLRRLEDAGCSADAIDLVICTHLHVDHVGWNTSFDGKKWVPTFPNARYLFGAQEYRYWQKNSRTEEEVAVFDDSVSPIVSAGLADFVEPEDRPCKELSFIATPGHSAGHMCLIVSSNGEEAVLAGDVAHSPCQFAYLDWSSIVDFDGKQASQTRRDVAARFADTPSLIFGGHFDPGRLVTDGDTFKMA
jgi:glyoxylase-like metal-dependent hydrolase (beta-lactamase superfamily II)